PHPSIVNPPALPALPFVKLTNREAEGSLSKSQSSIARPRSPVSDLQFDHSKNRGLVNIGQVHLLAYF
ncbi:MAG: hypothetical protein MUD01_24135, partial [Chloroflexaceae bacterium]|nr:hypothetical protein [Chloroflexaceae bacterium]